MQKPRRRRAPPSYDPTISRGIFAIFFIILALLTSLSFFEKAGALGIAFNHYILASLLGSMRYAVPAIFLIIAWYMIKDIEYNYKATHGVGVILFLLATTSLMHLKFSVSSMWTEAINGNGGGIIGMGALPLKTYIGSVGSIIILSGFGLISMLLIFNTSLAAFIMLHKKLLGHLGFIGNAIFSSVKTLFVRQNPIANFGGAYTAEDDDSEQNEEDERFSAQTLAIEKNSLAKENESEIENDGNNSSETETQDDEISANQDDAASPWAKKVVIRDLPSTNLLSEKRSKPTSGDIKANSQIIHDTLKEFGVDVDMGEIRVGPTVTQYSLKPHRGIKLSRITALNNNLALNLAAHSLRIEAPIPGKSLVGIEVPNQKTALVSFKELLESKEYQGRPHNMMVALGKDVSGRAWWADLPKMPHLLIAGATGSGKTVCINTIIMSLLFQNTAESLRFIMVDPKRVELTLYNGIPHLMVPVITNVQKTINALKWTIGEMERRFEALAGAGNRDIDSYNSRHREKMPHIVFVIDELADLMAAAASEVEAGIIRLAQMARAVGIHLIVATQRPSVDVITGLIKANIPARIAFSVASLIDSRTILDSSGAEKLLGRGDMLFQTAELSKPVRIQGAFIGEDELKSVAEYLQGDEEPEYDESIVEKANSSKGTLNMFGGPQDDQDPLFQEAKSEILKSRKASASFLQRKLRIGYSRAARILDELEAAGIIGPGDGAKSREILASTTTMDAGGELNVFDSKDADDAGEEKNDTDNDEQKEIYTTIDEI